MSIVIPTKVVQHVLDAPDDQASVAVNRVHSRDPERPVIVMLMNFGGWTSMLDTMELAIKHAPSPEAAEGWRLFALKVAEAIQQGVME